MGDVFECELAPPAGRHQDNFARTGSASVISNFLPTVRVGDPTACGATIFTGSPTVLIGGPAFGDEWATVDGIRIHGSPAFIARVTADLAVLRSLPDGAKLLAGMKDVTIVEYYGPNSYTIPLDMKGAYGGSGSGVVIGYNPNLTVQVNTDDGLRPTPVPLVLAHELCHALHCNNGTVEADDEPQTIGCGSHDGDSPTENSLRAQMDPWLGPRVDHRGKFGRAPGVPEGPVQ
jgi:hypothetical protein